MWLSYSKLSCDLFTFKMVLYLRKKGSNVTFSPWINVTFLTCFIFVVVIKHFWDMTSDCSWWFWHWVIYISMRWFCLKFASYLFTTCFMTIITRLPCRYLQGPLSPISRPRGEYHIFNTYFFSKLEAMTSPPGGRGRWRCDAGEGGGRPRSAAVTGPCAAGEGPALADYAWQRNGRPPPGPRQEVALVARCHTPGAQSLPGPPRRGTSAGWWWMWKDSPIKLCWIIWYKEGKSSPPYGSSREKAWIWFA